MEFREFNYIIRIHSSDALWSIRSYGGGGGEVHCENTVFIYPFFVCIWYTRHAFYPSPLTVCSLVGRTVSGNILHGERMILHTREAYRQTGKKVL